MKLDLGAGEYPKEGYTTVDAHFPADIEAPFNDLPVDDGSVEAIHMSHSLEHVPQKDVDSVLAECFRVLVPGGELFVDVPDMDGLCKGWLETPVERRVRILPGFYGDQHREGGFHYTGFSEPLLSDAMSRAGFEIVNVTHERSHAFPSVQVTGKKP